MWADGYMHMVDDFAWFLHTQGAQLTEATRTRTPAPEWSTTA